MCYGYTSNSNKIQSQHFFHKNKTSVDGYVNNAMLFARPMPLFYFALGVKTTAFLLFMLECIAAMMSSCEGSIFRHFKYTVAFSTSCHITLPFSFD